MSFIGDVILGLAPIDDFWWKGQNGGSEGIFPITHVIELEISKLLKRRSRSVHSSETLFAQALVDVVGQLDAELSFQAGDIITVTEVVDEDWYIGQCRGKSGMFLAACVQLLNEEECSTTTDIDSSIIKSSDTTCSSIKTEENTSHSQSKSQSNVPVNNDTVSYSHSVADDHADRSLSFNSENTKAHSESDTGVTPYARTLYPFLGELPDELSFGANDIVTLIQHVDKQWIEGEIDGKIGLIPVNYVEIVVDCPYAYGNEDMDIVITDEVVATETGVINQSEYLNNKVVHVLPEKEPISLSANQSVNNMTSCVNEECYALVVYDFNAETSKDITVHEGETVTVIKQIDDNWLLVGNDVGTTGMCPVNFVDIIGALPVLASHDDNDNEIKEVAGKLSEIKSGKSQAGDLRSTSGKLHDDLYVVVDSSKEIVSEASAKKMTSNTISNVDQSISSGKSTVNSKRVLKPKPLLAPKPALKAKPQLSPKPWATTSDQISFDPKSNIPKSTSSTTLSQYGAYRAPVSQSETMIKAQSMFEINKQSELEMIKDTSLSVSKGSNQSSASSLTSSTEVRTSESQSKNTFTDWDLTKPLDTLLHSEFIRAKQEADIKSKNSSTHNHGSSYSHNKSYEPEIKNVGVIDRAEFNPKSSIGNYSRDNFEVGLSVGNSTFFVSENIGEPKRGRHLRQPPVPPVKINRKDEDFMRKPSFKKPAPARPVGPRIAPAPSRTPIVPTRTPPPKPIPSHPAPGQHSGVPARSQGLLKKHGRPAPPRPRANPVKPPGDDLMSFGPTNSSICK